MAAQILAASGNELYYYTFLNEKTKHNYEIDFLLARKNKICPLELKSSGYRTHASLDAFTAKYSDRILERYLVYTKDFRKEEHKRGKKPRVRKIHFETPQIPGRGHPGIGIVGMVRDQNGSGILHLGNKFQNRIGALISATSLTES